MRTHTAHSPRGMPFTEEQMKQVFDTNLIDFAVRSGVLLFFHREKR